MKTVLDYLAEYGEMTDEDLQELLNMKKTRVYLLARQMNEDGRIKKCSRNIKMNRRKEENEKKRFQEKITITSAIKNCKRNANFF